MAITIQCTFIFSPTGAIVNGANKCLPVVL